MTRALLFGLLTLPAHLEAAELRASLTCELKDSAALFAEAGKGKKTVLGRGVRVIVLEASEPWARVRIQEGQHAGREGKMKHAWLSKVCQPLDPPEAAAEVVPDPVVAPARVENVTPAPDPGIADDEGFGKTHEIKVMVMDLGGSVDAELRSSLTAVIPETLEALGPFKAIAKQDIARMLEAEAQKQLLGCDDESCLAELGGALGADFMVTGSLTRVGGSVMVQMQLINTAESRVDARVSRTHEGDTQALFEAMRGATRQLVRDILGERSGSVRLTVSEEGATVAIDGSVVGVSPFAEPLTLAGGSHQLSVEKRGFVVFKQDFSVLEDQETTLSALLIPSTEFVRAYEDRTGFVRMLAWIGLGIGAAGVGTGAGILIATQGEARKLDDDIAAYNAQSIQTTDEFERLGRRERDLARWESGALAAFLVGAAAGATGAVLFFLGDDPDRYDAEGTVSGPTVAITPVGLFVGGRF